MKQKSRWTGLFNLNIVKNKIFSDDYQPVTLCVLPMFHVYGLNIVNMPFLHAGGKLVSLPGFEPRTFINALEEYKVRSCTIKSGSVGSFGGTN